MNLASLKDGRNGRMVVVARDLSRRWRRCGKTSRSRPFLKFGDKVRIEMRDAQGRSIFGAIEQDMVGYSR